MYRGGTAISSFYHGTVSCRMPGCGVGARAMMRERECVFGERVFGGPGRNKYEKLAFSPCSFHGLWVFCPWSEGYNLCEVFVHDLYRVPEHSVLWCSGFNYFQSHEGNEAKISEPTLAPSHFSLCPPSLPLFHMTTENDALFSTMTCMMKLHVSHSPPPPPPHPHPRPPVAKINAIITFPTSVKIHFVCFTVTGSFLITIHLFGSLNFPD